MVKERSKGGQRVINGWSKGGQRVVNGQIGAFARGACVLVADWYVGFVGGFSLQAVIAKGATCD